MCPIVTGASAYSVARVHLRKIKYCTQRNLITELLRKIVDTDLIAQEAKYHKQCYSLFVLKSKKAPSATSNSEDYGKSDVFDRLLSIVEHDIFQER